MSASHTFDGKSSLTVVSGDYTLTCEVENFAIDMDERWETVESWYGNRVFKDDVTYTIRSSNILPNEEGYYFTVKKAGVKTVERTATIEVKSWNLEQINEALVACGAPKDAIPEYERRDGKHYVQFKWEEVSGRVGI